MRLEMVRKLLETDGLNVEEDINLTSITSKMDGYVATDVRHLIDKATHLAASEAGKTFCVFLIVRFD
jgi:hypothetical protein